MKYRHLVERGAESDKESKVNYMRLPAFNLSTTSTLQNAPSPLF